MLAIDGKYLWRERREDCPDCQVQGAVRVHRVMRALLTSARPRLFLDQRSNCLERQGQRRMSLEFQYKRNS
jgi:hypothetical protein